MDGERNIGGQVRDSGAPPPSKAILEAELSTDLEGFLTGSYRELAEVLRRQVDRPMRIMDLGCNDGKIEEYLDSLGYDCEVDCLDVNENALHNLEEKKFRHLRVNPRCQDGNEMLEQGPAGDYDLVIMNNVLHELNTPADQSGYLDEFFARLRRDFPPSAKILLADHYYPENLPEEEVSQFIEAQFKKIKHADARNKFILPELVELKIADAGYTVIYHSEMRATEEIDKRYYVYVIQNRDTKGGDSPQTPVI